jgi:hypothetical protein
MDPTREEQFMKRAATILGIAAALAIPSVASAGNSLQVKPKVTAQVVTTQVVTAQISKPQVATTQRVTAARVVAQRATGYRIALQSTAR